MFLKQFFVESLGHASYLVGSEETGEALVLDPQRRVDDYFSVAPGPRASASATASTATATTAISQGWPN